MTIPKQFTQILPPTAGLTFGEADAPQWVAVRFDGQIDIRSGMSPYSLKTIARWPGNWAWCLHSELMGVIERGTAENPATATEPPSDPQLLAKYDALKLAYDAIVAKDHKLHSHFDEMLGEARRLTKLMGDMLTYMEDTR